MKAADKLREATEARPVTVRDLPARKLDLSEERAVRGGWLSVGAWAYTTTSTTTSTSIQTIQGEAKEDRHR